MAGSEGVGGLGETLIPAINRLQDIFSQVICGVPINQHAIFFFQATTDGCAS